MANTRPGSLFMETLALIAAIMACMPAIVGVIENESKVVMTIIPLVGIAMVLALSGISAAIRESKAP